MAAVLAVATVSATAAEAITVRRSVTTSLSNERTLSRWAYPAQRANIRAFPRVTAKTVARLRLTTEDLLPEVYLLLSSRVLSSGGEWIRLRIPGRPSGRTGWVRREALGAFHRVTTLLVLERAKRRVTLYRRGRRVFAMPVGVGKPDTPTPAGRFWIREKFVVSNPRGLYGPRALGTAAYAPGLSDWPKGGVIGFHGTNRPGLIPGAPSHGCVRLRNPDVLRFYRSVPIGTPLRIR